MPFLVRQAGGERDLQGQLQLGMQAMRQTVERLGSHPTPAEVDRSNLRRLLRAMVPLLDICKPAYPADDLRKARRGMARLMRVLGHYKDGSNLEASLRSLQGGTISGPVEAELRADLEGRQREFDRSWAAFRRRGCDKLLRHLDAAASLPAGMLQKRWRKVVRNAVRGVERSGLGSRDPERFHDERKALRVLLQAVNATRGEQTYPLDEVARLKRLVNDYGVAHDSYVAAGWLADHGFPDEAQVMDRRYHDQHQAACRLSLDASRLLPGN